LIVAASYNCFSKSYTSVIFCQQLEMEIIVIVTGITELAPSLGTPCAAHAAGRRGEGRGRVTISIIV
jgi:hypothetical protein